MASKPDKTREALLKARVEGYSDEELRAECKAVGLKPGPINEKTRKAWVRRLTEKQLEAQREERH